jgi:hypothetical protein
MTQIQVLFKNRASDCNKELLEFLHRNIGKMKTHFTVKAVILKDKPDHQLPAVQIDDKLIVGKTAIINELKTLYAEKSKPKTADDDVRSWITEQMNTGDNESEDRSGDIAKKLASDAFRKREEYNEFRNAKPKPSGISKKPKPISKTNKPSETLPSELEKDPMMAKFWEGQGM